MTGHCPARRPQPPATRDDARVALDLAIGADDNVIAIGLLDRLRHPLTMAIIEGCPCGADDILRAVAFVLDATTDLDAVVLGTRGTPLPTGEEFDLWRTVQLQCATAGVSLLEWLVFDEQEAYSVPERWTVLPSWS